METELSIRLSAYFHVAETQRPGKIGLYAEAIASSDAASAAASAGLICSHPRELRGDSTPGYVPPGRDELDFLISGAVASGEAGNVSANQAANAPDETQHWAILPLPPDRGGIDNLALGAAGVSRIKSHDAE